MNSKLLLLLWIAVLMFSCDPDKNDFEYERANSENIYEALKNDGQFNLLLEAVDTLNYDDALKFTLNTVLAPPDDVFQKYMDSKGYQSIGDFPKEELRQLVEHHVLTWLYPSGQFKDKPKVFRRETKVRMPDQWEEYDGANYLIHKENKFQAFLTPEFFKAYGGSEDDYQKFYNTPLGEMNIYGVEITKLDWLVSNGWIHVVDNVVEPVRNLHDWLQQEKDYSIFASLVDRYRVFASTSADETGTPRFYNNSDVIPNIHFSLAGFWPDNESFKDDHQSSKFLSMLAYNDESMGQLFLDYLSESFNSYEDVPDFIIRSIITPNLFIDKIILPSNIDNGQLNKDDQIIEFDTENSNNIIEFCSNGIVYGSTTYQAPRSFQSILKPCYTDTSFSYFAEMLIRTGYDKVLNDKETRYTVFMPSNAVFNADSIIMDEKADFYHLNENGSRGAELKQAEIADIVLSSIIIGDLGNSEYAQFEKCIGGWYVGFGQDSVWSGGNWSRHTPLIAGEVSEPEVDNGNVKYVTHLVKAPEKGIGEIIAENEEYSAFYNLCKQAGLYSPKGTFNFFAHPSYYTAFVPANDVIAASFPDIPTDSLERVHFVLSHFVEGNIYTDGEVSGVQNSAAPDLNASTEFEEVYLPVDVNNVPGNLQVKGNANNTAVSVINEHQFSNVICLNGVVQLIDGVILNQQK